MSSRKQRSQRVLQRRRGAAQATKQAGRGDKLPSAARPVEPSNQSRDLPTPEFDHERLGRQTYLTIRELTAYGSFKTENATYCFLTRYRHKVPKCGRGGTVLVLRRDFDRFVQSRGGVRHAS